MESLNNEDFFPFFLKYGIKRHSLNDDQNVSRSGAHFETWEM